MLRFFSTTVLIACLVFAAACGDGSDLPPDFDEEAFTEEFEYRMEGVDLTPDADFSEGAEGEAFDPHGA